MNSADQSFNLQPNLTERLRDRIQREGPLTFRDWMEAALYDPLDGYYCRLGHERWGRTGDYRTSPERSPLFAATFARYFVHLYHELNRPERFSIVEAGAGEGHFAEIVLQTMQQQSPEAFAVTTYVVDELSAASTGAAKLRLARFGDSVSFASLAQLSLDDAGIVFSNELLDAFPVHRVKFSNDELRELYVGLSDSGEFDWISGPLSTSQLSEYFKLLGVQLNEGQIAEVSLGVGGWLAGAAAKLSRGYIITVDYGAEAAELYATRHEGTLRAFRRHEFREVLKDPGENDITTTVDWTYVRKLGEKLGLEMVECERQDRFLLRAGLLEQLELLVSQSEPEADKTRLRVTAREMILPTSMANSFQVLVQKKL